MADQSKEQNTLSKQSISQERCQFWRTHLNSWATSGLSQVEYCRQNGLKSSRFTYWKHKLNKEHLPIEFVQVFKEHQDPSHLLPNNGTPSLRLTVGTRFAIEIMDGFSSNTLEQILLTLDRI